jgi:hypothetical protein
MSIVWISSILWLGDEKDFWDILSISAKMQKSESIEMITALGKFVDMFDICNFYKRCNLPLCWRYLNLEA